MLMHLKVYCKFFCMKAAWKQMSRCENGIVFLALARNCARYLPALFGILEGISSLGMNVVAVIGENGSSDNTAYLLDDERQRHRNIIHIDTSFMENIPSRYKRMAEGREALSRYAATYFSDAKYVCVVDVDNVLSAVPPSKAILLSAQQLYSRTDLFGVSAISAPHYYDLAALRCEGLFDENVLPQIADAKKGILLYYTFMRRKVFEVQKRVTSSHIRLCKSAFNGLCVYKAQDYFSSTYITDDVEDVCEHVVLNLGIHQVTGRRILIDDHMVLSMPREHGPQTLAAFVGRRALKLTRLT